MPDPADSSGADIQSNLRHAVVAVDLPCRGCGYDLKGLRGDGNCPECGLPVADTITSVVDPHASRLPRLRNPKLVGNGLLWLLLMTVIAAGMIGLHAALRWFSPGAGGLVRGPEHLPLASAAASLLGLWSVMAFMPPRGREPDTAIWRDLLLLLAGLAAWSAAAVGLWARGVALSGQGVTAAWSDPPTIGIGLALTLSAVPILLGIGGVLDTIGRRSLAYRRSHAARQGVRSMIAAMIGASAGLVLKGIASIWPAPDWAIVTDHGPVFIMNIVAIVGGAVLAACGVMAVIGLLYMLVNAAWIRRALRKPPPFLEQLVLPALPPDTRVPGEEGEEDGQ